MRRVATLCGTRRGGEGARTRGGSSRRSVRKHRDESDGTFISRHRMPRRRPQRRGRWKSEDGLRGEGRRVRFQTVCSVNLNRQNTNTNGSIHFASVSRAGRTTSRARSGRRALSADAKHARLAEHSTSSSLKVERTMAALTASMANMAVAAKAQRVGGVRRIAAKASVARVGGLKAPASAHMRTGTRPARVSLGLSPSSRVVSPGSARSRPPRSPPGARIPASARAVPRNLKLGLLFPRQSH